MTSRRVHSTGQPISWVRGAILTSLRANNKHPTLQTLQTIDAMKRVTIINACANRKEFKVAELVSASGSTLPFSSFFLSDTFETAVSRLPLIGIHYVSEFVAVLAPSLTWNTLKSKCHHVESDVKPITTRQCWN